MDENEFPSECPFCKKEHTLNLLKVSKKSEVTCPDCKNRYFIPYSEIKSIMKFQQDLDDLVGRPDSENNNH
jgi:hypothetical protein